MYSMFTVSFGEERQRHKIDKIADFSHFFVVQTEKEGTNEEKKEEKEGKKDDKKVKLECVS